MTIYQNNLENNDPVLLNLARECAEQVLEDVVDSFQKSLMMLMQYAETNEERVAIIKMALGDEIPDMPDDCLVIPIDGSELLHAIMGSGDGDEDDESGEHHCDCGCGCGGDCHCDDHDDE